ncbi:peptidase M12A astacin [Pseudomonas yamanorum]|jgi:hypothetical protein|uniref:M12 family metallopeptidase n=1 Tax=Pseudomonas yamanorum TaxID=515393 RepID=UPI0015A08BA3|nr:M12 family metallopeptidase [Pseudomonas yamanorum]NWD24949.1 peptidase M12A astacin [Pseudomonas yamanorum]
MNLSPLTAATNSFSNSAYERTTEHSFSETKSEGVGRKKRGIADPDTIWPSGTLTVGLDIQNKKSEHVIKQAICEWIRETPSLNVRFVEGNNGQIRISDDPDIKGNWSALGADANNWDKSEPTMHLDRTDNTKDLYSNALHEFGHALGLKHEHQHPDAKTDWDEAEVARRAENRGYPVDLVLDSAFNKFSATDSKVTPYDPNSVMHYELPENDDLSKKTMFHVKDKLSEGDKQLANELYKIKH